MLLISLFMCEIKSDSFDLLLGIRRVKSSANLIGTVSGCTAFSEPTWAEPIYGPVNPCGTPDCAITSFEEEIPWKTTFCVR